MKFLFKFLSLFILPTLVIILTFYYLKTLKVGVLTIEEKTGEIIYSIPYQNTLYQDFGMVYTPNIVLSVKTVNGLKNINFLVDTGAIVSALPATEAPDLGINLAFLPRVAVQGYGNKTTFTYRGSLTIKLFDEFISLPCIFSEVDSSNYILGRKGLFENYTLRFNAKKKAVEFIKNN